MDAAIARPDRHSQAPLQPFMAADVGGTHARVALVQPSEVDGRAIEILAYRKLECRDYSDLGEALKFFADDAAIPARRCVLACAGQVVGDEVLHDNLAWPISLSGLRKTLAFDDVALLNDFEALGWSLEDPGSLDSRLLCGPDTRASGPTLVVGPGTGLGAAVHLPGRGRGSVLATEAGQMDFAPRTLREREVLASLAPEGGYVPYERIVSGPGLLTLYGTLRGLGGKPPVLATPEEVTAAARESSDREAVEAVEMFCALLGSFAGNLAMVFMAAGGVYLAGGFLSSMFDLLQQSRFAERFLHERSVRAFLEHVPVRVMEHGQHGVLGAARWYLGRSARDQSVPDRVAQHESAG
ncbi:MAG TPA: glucokinase [Rhodanobacteraceae bacterium]